MTRKRKDKELEGTQIGAAWERMERQAEGRSEEHKRIEKVKGPRRDIARDVSNRELSAKQSATPERWERAGGNVEISDKGVQRILDQPLDRLRTRGTITERQYQAGDRLRTDFFYAGMRPISSSDIRMGGGGSPDSRWVPGFMAQTETQAAARKRFRAAEQHLGPRLFSVLDTVVIDPLEPEMDPNAYDLALVGQKFFGRKQKGEARAAMIEVTKMALDQLADHYRLDPDGARQSVYNPAGKAKIDEDQWEK